MPSGVYRTKRKKIAEAMKNQLMQIDGAHPFNLNVFDNVSSKMKFLDEIEQYPKLCVVAGDESREYLPDAYKWRFLTLTIRAYVHNEDDAQEELALLLEDIEKIIDENDALVYDDTVDPSESTTSMTLESISTDEGVVEPLGIGEMSIIVRY